MQDTSDVSALAGARASREHACSSAEHRRVDFLTGNWLVWEPSGGTVGTVTISSEYGGCVLVEKRSGIGDASDGLGVWGYRIQERRWRRDYLDGSGRLLTLEGGWEGDRLVLTGRDYPRDGSTRIHRSSWQAMADGSIEELWQTTTDAMGAWQIRSHGVLRRYGE